MDAGKIAEFFYRVLPWPVPGQTGFVNLHWQNEEKFWGGRPFTDLKEFSSFAGWLHRNPQVGKEIYFCTSLQSETGPIASGKKYPRALRATENDIGHKCIQLDVDVKEPPKGYATKNEAFDAIAKFLVDAKLPPLSALVDSGGGFHCYWISNKLLTPDEWIQFATGLRNLAEQHGLRCDLAVTIDSVRILRVPGTNNRKTGTPRPVKLLALAKEDYDFESALGHIRSNVPRVAATTKREVSSNLIEFDAGSPLTDVWSFAAADEIQAEIGEVHNVSDELDIRPLVEHNGCPFLFETLRTGGKEHDQTLWMMTGLTTTFLANGRAVFQKMSEGHKDYDPANVDKMFDRKLEERLAKNIGWPQCERLQAMGAKECAGCKHRGTIKSPLNLTKPFVKEPPKEGIERFLKTPFRVNKTTRQICTVIPSNKKGGPDKIVDLMFCEILGEPWMEQGATDGVHFLARLDKHCVRDIFVPVKWTGGLNAMSNGLAEQGVQLSDEYRSEAIKMMNSFIEKVRKEMGSIKAVPYGWWKSHTENVRGFAYDGIIYCTDGKERPAPTGDVETRKMFSAVGEIEPWYAALKTITDQHRPQLEVVVAVAFAAPLMKLLDKKGAVVAAKGPGGGNKSTAAAVGMAVWGTPEMTKMRPETSSASLLGRAGNIKNLSMYWDDVREHNLKTAAHAVGQITEGGTPGRMDQQRNQKPIETWETQLCICTNGSLFDTIAKASPSDSSRLMRIFEIEILRAPKTAPGRMEEWDIGPIIGALDENAGKVGHVYARLLGEKRDEIQRTVLAQEKRFGKYIENTEVERFWLAICATIITGVNLANDGLGCTFNVAEIENFLIEAYKNMRSKILSEAAEGGTKENTERALGQFFKAHGENEIWTRVLAGRGSTNVGYIDGPSRKEAPVHIQWVTGERVVRISKEAFEKYLILNKYDTSTTIDGLKKHESMTLDRGNLAYGTGRAGQSRETLFRMPVPPGDWKEELLKAQDNNLSLISNVVREKKQDVA